MSKHDEAQVRVKKAKVFVRGLKVEAEIGIYDHEKDRRQPLLIDVEIGMDAHSFEHIADTVNYERVRDAANAVAGAGHVMLVETFALRLARACLEEPHARKVRVRIEKPQALAPDAEGAGVELTLEK